jgi:ParB-like chromosome segregation protein Spo0J
MQTNDKQPPALQTIYLTLDDLHASPTNPRKTFDAEKLAELADSIRQHSVQMPLLVRPSKTEPGRFEIIAGERRFRASRQLVDKLEKAAEGSEDAGADKLRDIATQRRFLPAIVRPDLSDATVLEMQLIENLQREDLTAMEEAEGYAAMLKLPDYTPQKIATKIGKSVRTVTARLRILDAPRVLVDAFLRGEISERHLRLVATVPGVKQREACAKRVLEGEHDWETGARVPLSSRVTADLVNEEYRRTLQGAPFDLDDADLVKDAGACSACPHLLRNAAALDPSLAEDMGGFGADTRGGAKPLTCLNPACLQRKQDAAFKRARMEAEAGGVVIMSAEETAAIFDASGELVSDKFVKLDEAPGYEHTGHFDRSKTPTWRELMDGRTEPGVVKLANVKGVGLVEVAEKKTAVEIAQGNAEHGAAIIGGKSGAEKSDAEKKAAEKAALERKIDLRVRPVLLSFLFDAAKSKGGAETARALLESVLFEAGMDGCRMLSDWLKLSVDPAKKNERLSQEHYRRAVMRYVDDNDLGKADLDALLLVAVHSKWIKAWGAQIASLAPLQKLFGFDSKTIRALAAAEVKAEVKTKKEAKKAAPNSTDPDNWTAAHEVSKTAAADQIAKVKPAAGELDEDATAAALAAGTTTITDAIGPKPDRKKAPDDYKRWNATRMRLNYKAAKLKK